MQPGSLGTAHPLWLGFAASKILMSLLFSIVLTLSFSGMGLGLAWLVPVRENPLLMAVLIFGPLLGFSGVLTFKIFARQKAFIAGTALGGFGWLLFAALLFGLYVQPVS